MQFYRRSQDVSSDMDEMHSENNSLHRTASEEFKGGRLVTVRLLFKEEDLRRPLFIACVLAVIQQFSGINAVRRRHR